MQAASGDTKYVFGWSTNFKSMAAKVAGYIPFVGSIVGIGRAILFAKNRTPKTTTADENWTFTRCALEIIPGVNTIALPVADFVATVVHERREARARERKVRDAMQYLQPSSNENASSTREVSEKLAQPEYSGGIFRHVDECMREGKYGDAGQALIVLAYEQGVDIPRVVAKLKNFVATCGADPANNDIVLRCHKEIERLEGLLKDVEPRPTNEPEASVVGPSSGQEGVLARADACVQRGDYESAMIWYVQAVDEGKADREQVVNSLRALVKLCQPELAGKIRNKIAEWTLYEAMEQEGNKNYSEAKALYEGLIRDNRQTDSAHMGLGRIYMQKDAGILRNLALAREECSKIKDKAKAAAALERLEKESFG